MCGKNNWLKALGHKQKNNLFPYIEPKMAVGRNRLSINFYPLLPDTYQQVRRQKLLFIQNKQNSVPGNMSTPLSRAKMFINTKTNENIQQTSGRNIQICIKISFSQLKQLQ